RLNGRHGPAHDAHADQMLLSPAQEAVLVEWCHYLSLTAHPLNRRTLAPKVEAIAGKTPGIHWIERFLERHAEELHMGGTSGLDLKRARSFNFTTV
ncbi:hypothetical protein PLICRDRAFT_60902, partial [Plicaturopsis crispa FD-325 SS-3]